VHGLVTASIAALSDPARFRITGDTVTVGPDQALSLTLALHELITNAMKYGALLSPAGTVELRWSVDQESGIFSMDWREMGGPETREPIRKGFGTFLLKRNVAAEFGGNVRLSYQPSGLEWHLKAPLSALHRL
jgi:two-component sensor histidine kinase